MGINIFVLLILFSQEKYDEELNNSFRIIVFWKLSLFKWKLCFIFIIAFFFLIL